MLDWLSPSLPLALAVLAMVSVPSVSTAGDWALDPAHTRASFRVRHMMVSWVRGDFGSVSGTVRFDEKDLKNSSVEVTIDASTLDTREAKRDEHLRSPDFFDVAKHPSLVFKSNKVVPGKQGTFEIQGDLTIRGVTRPVVLQVEGPSPFYKNPWGATAVGFHGTTTIKRGDFGLTWNKALEAGGWLVGDEIFIEIDAELSKQG